MTLMKWADKCLRKALRWLKLSNSGDVLKLLVPSRKRKFTGGWSNYSGTVISQKMNESKMDYRGSKSIIFESIIVKEQRVDGSWLLNKIAAPNRSLRCTLAGFERNYQIKILSKQLNNASFSILSNQLKINPWLITGFSDAEGSFIISVYQDVKSKLKWRVSAYFSWEYPRRLRLFSAKHLFADR